MAEGPYITLNIDGSVEGDLDIMAEYAEVRISGDVTGNIRIRQADAANVRVVVAGEEVKGDNDPEHRALGGN
jgi:hypothetical protein